MTNFCKSCTNFYRDTAPLHLYYMEGNIKCKIWWLKWHGFQKFLFGKLYRSVCIFKSFIRSAILVTFPVKSIWTFQCEKNLDNGYTYHIRMDSICSSVDIKLSQCNVGTQLHKHVDQSYLPCTVVSNDLLLQAAKPFIASIKNSLKKMHPCPHRQPCVYVVVGHKDGKFWLITGPFFPHMIKN